MITDKKSSEYETLKQDAQTNASIMRKHCINAFLYAMLYCSFVCRFNINEHELLSSTNYFTIKLVIHSIIHTKKIFEKNINNHEANIKKDDDFINELFL